MDFPNKTIVDQFPPHCLLTLTLSKTHSKPPPPPSSSTRSQSFGSLRGSEAARLVFWFSASSSPTMAVWQRYDTCTPETRPENICSSRILSRQPICKLHLPGKYASQRRMREEMSFIDLLVGRRRAESGEKTEERLQRQGFLRLDRPLILLTSTCF